MKINIYENLEIELKKLCSQEGISPTKLTNLLLADLLNHHTHSRVMINEILKRTIRDRTNNTKD